MDLRIHQPIQGKAIPIMNEKDLIAQNQSGTGKTGHFYCFE